MSALGPTKEQFAMVYRAVCEQTDPVRAWNVIRDMVLEAAAAKCEEMVIGGHAWTHDEERFAEALLAAALAIRAMKGEP